MDLRGAAFSTRQAFQDRNLHLSNFKKYTKLNKLPGKVFRLNMSMDYFM